VRSPFAEILRQAVEATPGAVGGAFAASDGEMVDYFARRDSFEWALVTAHYGVVLSHVQLALNTWHYGEASMVMIEHQTLAILIHSVKDGYYAMMAVGHPAPLGRAMHALSRAAAHLREEMS
jgi:predicted regulator of Ras-like GTPase activity (Roadblock/LC7/MglB family)